MNVEAQGVFLTRNGDVHIPAKQRILAELEENEFHLHLQASTLAVAENYFWIVPLSVPPISVKESSDKALNDLAGATDVYFCEDNIDGCLGTVRKATYPSGRPVNLNTKDVILNEYVENFSSVSEFVEWFEDAEISLDNNLPLLSKDYIDRGFTFYIAEVKASGGIVSHRDGLPPRVFDLSQSNDFLLLLAWLSVGGDKQSSEASIIISDRRFPWKPDPVGLYQAKAPADDDAIIESWDDYDHWIKTLSTEDKVPVLAELFNAGFKWRAGLNELGDQVVFKPCRSMSMSWEKKEWEISGESLLIDMVKIDTFLSAYYLEIQEYDQLDDLRFVPNSDLPSPITGRYFIKKTYPCTEERVNEPAHYDSMDAMQDPLDCDSALCDCFRCGSSGSSLCALSCSISKVGNSSSGCHQDDYDDDTSSNDSKPSNNNNGSNGSGCGSRGSGCSGNDYDDTDQYDSTGGCMDSDSSSSDESSGCSDDDTYDDDDDDGCSSTRGRRYSRRFKGNMLCMFLAIGVVFGRRFINTII